MLNEQFEIVEISRKKRLKKLEDIRKWVKYRDYLDSKYLLAKEKGYKTASKELEQQINIINRKIEILKKEIQKRREKLIKKKQKLQSKIWKILVEIKEYDKALENM